MITDVERQFLRAIVDRPDDRAQVNVYHDWLIDQGRGLDAEAVQATLIAPAVEKLTDLRGRVLAGVIAGVGDLSMDFVLVDGTRCCLVDGELGSGNDVQINVEEVHGDLEDLLGTPLLEVEEETGERLPGEENVTWTFYRFATLKGRVTVRFFGTSNGYYSEVAEFQVARRGRSAQ